MKKFNATEMLEGAIDGDIKPAIKDLNDEQLKELHDVEEKGQNRTTLIDLLHREMSDRSDAAKAKAEQEAQAKAEQEAKAKAEQEAKAKAEQEAQAKAEQEAKAKAEQEAQAKAEQEAQAKTADQIVIKRPKVGKKLELPKKSVDFDPVGEPMVDFLQVVLTNETDEMQPVATSPARAHEFSVSSRFGVKLVFNRKIAMNREHPKAVVKKAWLLTQSGVPITFTELSSVLDGGGGRQAEIPAGHLAFHIPEQK